LDAFDEIDVLRHDPYVDVVLLAILCLLSILSLREHDEVLLDEFDALQGGELVEASQLFYYLVVKLAVVDNYLEGVGDRVSLPSCDEVVELFHLLALDVC